MLEAIDIHKVYNDTKKSLPVLKGITLRIEGGEFVAIVGPSGAGKSTLLHILGGLDSPSSGRVVFRGEDIYKLSDEGLAKARNEKIGFVFQFYHLLSEFTVMENTLLPGLIKNEKGGNLKKRAAELLNQVGLKDRINYFPSQLSGGEKQRVAVARSLINSPSLLFCDEPTGNLDSKSGEGIISLVKDINIKNKMTVVLVTHNSELAKVADKVYHLCDGRCSYESLY
ncbi:MAG: lipoprotein-releasing system ATP-binding protein LolD [Candidatus Omnitrophica bacterium CG08_land_8_20_14_0_20_41_16]|uniref:Lipoprotein-releasing system ATP-binding protein LolD n=1 Tax=Candidatus Sherwoodlollariibacterium unditelluris TaxID=1974757 RepID=A0A2G9YJD9_9BACT|nr:MAG: lipoprotein-releasing system ATP-binding protein LolD [Candidatus Omnitrophica bacterium CG23_combo_of_CG06-09_8_20_14_all_41_10]PIS34415.1 MAG: lipoprotein-releasing system ATP-binding protein LolD [Candidatus Omnitrophica bacterium CG08_land_8_20_14_0_20_41_16]